jgi:phosphotransferase system HPr (HPr) family protein
MHESRLRVCNPLGLHARAAAQLVKLSGTFSCDITITRLDNGVFADAKSILSVLTLAASAGTELLLRTDGNDESTAALRIEELFTNGFGEIESP